MNVYISFEAVSVIMLLITIFFYSYKNWLSLRKNSIYMRLLAICVVAILTDVLLGHLSLQYNKYTAGLQMLSGICMSIYILVLNFHILLYDLAVTRQMRITRTVSFRCFKWIIIVTGLLSAISIVMDFDAIYVAKEDHFYGAGNILQIVVITICLLLGIFFIIHNEKVLTRREFWTLAGTNLLLIFDLYMQIMIRARNLASYYTIALVLILYYMILHNLDQYRFLSSGCFSRAGFNKILSEKAHYRENFVCLGICINNIESITNYCTENEIMQLHRRLGEELRNHCGRHNVYNIHSFEYMIVMKSTEAVEKKHRELVEGIPLYIRINDKNISILCDFYTVEFADAGYDSRNFNRILTSMRKLAMAQMNRQILLYYQGEKQLEIQNDLEAMRVVNNCIARRHFDFQIQPIQSISNLKEKSCEMVLCGRLENGTDISQERIWELANETGYITDVGYIACEMMCDYIESEKMLESKIRQVHLNFSPNQILNPIATEGYVKILSERGIPGNRICFEITIDQSVDYEKITKSFLILKEYGISILLDQFGVCACNLKNVLNMPFDSVKVNHHMVRTYCIGESRQLTYLINMLKERGWQIFLDGVDRLDQIEILSKLEVSNIQGQALLLDSFHEEAEAYFRETGGASVD